ncbi:TlpA disulfide reductase family protein [Chitinophaga tropicalis]|nr:TlpA disulfide reductase family protein [Chitinophaga tropicalis]
MKLLPILFLLPTVCTAFDGPGKGYTIKGNIAGMQSGTAYLSHTWKEKEITDSVAVVNGAFTFKGVTPEPLIYTLKLSGNKQAASFFVENLPMTVTADKDSLFKAKVTGSREQDIFKEFYNVRWKIVTETAGGIYRRIDSVTEKGKVKMDEPTRKAFDKEWAFVEKLNDSVITEYVKTYPDAIASAVVVHDRYIAYPYPDRAEALWPVFTKKVQQSFYGKQIKAAVELAAKTAIGKTAPEFAMADSTGKMIKLSNFRGKYVLVDFWASWCGPCRKENPNVVKAYQAYHDKGFEIIGVSLDSKKEAWLKAIAADGLTWTHVSDLKGWQNTAAAAYGVKSVPASFLLDKDGKIVGKGLRGEELHKKLESLLN